MNALTTIPPQVRSNMYLASFLIGIALAAIQVGFQSAGESWPVWLKVTMSVYAFLASALGLTAKSNVDVPPPGD